MKNKSTGFSLLEMIAVMAIMGILAGALAPNVFDAIKRAKSDAETQSLNALISSLKTSIIDTKQIPTSTTSNWVNAIAASSSFNKDDIEFNTFGYRRRLIFDPHFFTSSDQNFPGLVQNQGLASPPVSPRIMLISELTQNASSINNIFNDFNNVWEQNASALIKETNDIKIVRLNLTGSFHRIILSNESPQQASYQLESGSDILLPAASGGTDGNITRYVLSNTKITLKEPSLLFGIGDAQQTSVITSDWTSRYQTNGTSWFWAKP